MATSAGKNVLENVTKSSSAYNIKLKAVKGEYKVSINSSKDGEASIILARQEVNHLTIKSNILMDRPSIF